MKKFLTLISLTCILLFSAVVDVQAAIRNRQDMMIAAQKLQQLQQFDFLSLVNRNELIGYRLDEFNMSTMQYKANVTTVLNSLVNISRRMDTVMNSADFSDTEKQMQMNQLLQEADVAVSDINVKSVTYLMLLKNSMPTITYSRYVKRFQEYYNSLDITNDDISVR